LCDSALVTLICDFAAQLHDSGVTQFVTLLCDFFAQTCLLGPPGKGATPQGSDYMASVIQ